MARSLRLYSLEGNRQRLDGGAMFGHVPRALWSRWEPPDAEGRIELACRVFLLVDEENDRRILIDAGIGVPFEAKLCERYGVHSTTNPTQPRTHDLLAELARFGFAPRDIDVIVLSHLHFDHAGGLRSIFEAGEDPKLVFPEATYFVSQVALERARRPHLRDRASFLAGLPEQLIATGRLQTIASEVTAHPLGPAFAVTFSHGHTPGLMITEVRLDQQQLIFPADLIPGTSWLHPPIAMGYDAHAERTVEEKAMFLPRVVAEGAWLCFTHDPRVAACTVSVDANAGYRVARSVVAITGELPRNA